MFGDFMYIFVGRKKYDLYECVDFYSRFKGLMFTNDFDYCLRFEKCNSIHTFFMSTDIDVIMTDKNNNVLYTFKNLKPWRVILPKKNVYNVYELPSGSIKNNIKKVKIGE